VSRLKRAVVTALLLSLFPSGAWAADREAWHRYMRDGNLASNIQDFTLADALFKKAFDVARDLSKEEQWLSMVCRGSLAEDLGKYEEAEKFYSQALELSDDYEVAYCLINVLDKEKKNDEAHGLRKRFKYRTAEQHKSEKSCMSLVQSEVGKEWHERLPQAPEFHKIQAFATQ
jgi:tetratricopeptide (TPR) repeat protein